MAALRTCPGLVDTLSESGIDSALRVFYSHCQPCEPSVPAIQSFRSERMTPYEYLDLAQSAFSSSISSYAVFLSIISGYLVTAYLVGAKLTKTQISMLNTLFLLVVSFLIFSISSYVFWGTEFSSLAGQEGAERPLMAPRTWMSIVLALVNLFTAAICLVFMWNMRHSK